MSDSEHNILQHSLPYFDSYIIPSLPWVDSVDFLDSAEHSRVTYAQHFDLKDLCINLLLTAKEACLIKAEKALVTRCKHKWKQCDNMSG